MISQLKGRHTTVCTHIGWTVATHTHTHTHTHTDPLRLLLIKQCYLMAVTLPEVYIMLILYNNKQWEGPDVP